MIDFYAEERPYDNRKIFGISDPLPLVRIWN